MIEYKTRVRVMNPMGLHARPGVKIVRCVQAHRPSELEMRCLSTNSRAIGHSLLSILSLGAGRDSEIELITRGPRADELLKAVMNLFESDFAVTEGPNESDNEEIVARGANLQRAGDW